MLKTYAAVNRRRVGFLAASTLALCCTLAPAQAPPASPMQPAAVAGLKDTLLAKATELYDSTAKSGLRSFNCQVHPDWQRMLASARKTTPAGNEDPKLALLGAVKIGLDVRIGGVSTLDWNAQSMPDAASTALLKQARQGIESTLLGALKLSMPLMDGSVAESFGEDGMDLAETADGYTLRSKQKGASVTEEFERSLLLRHFIAVDSGATVDIEPIYQPTLRGLLLKSFVARVQPANAPPAGAHSMNVSFAYQEVAGIPIPASIHVDVPGVVEMDFKLDSCRVNMASN